jgi:hypothetical protein
MPNGGTGDESSIPFSALLDFCPHDEYVLIKVIGKLQQGGHYETLM